MEFIFVNDRNFCIFKFDVRVTAYFSQLTEMYTLCFAFGDSDNVCVCPICNLPNALLQLMLGSSHIFGSRSDAEVINIEVILNSRSQTLCDAVYFYIEQSH